MALLRDDQRNLVTPDDRPFSGIERYFLKDLNVASNGTGVCVISHDLFPVGTHQCMGPGVPPGMGQDDGDGPDSGTAQGGFGGDGS